MNLTLSEDQIRQFETNGFLAIDDVLDKSELERWRMATDDAVAMRLEAGGRHNQSVTSDPFYRSVFTQAMHLSRLHPGLHELVFDPRLAQFAARLVHAGGMRLWHDQALIKEPYANQTSFHRDTPYWSTSSRRTVNFWFALDDATLENGCLWYLPGTHKLGDFTHVRSGPAWSDLLSGLSGMAIDQRGSHARAGRRPGHPQWHGGTRRRRKHDAAAATGHDHCLFSGR